MSTSSLIADAIKTSVSTTFWSQLSLGTVSWLLTYAVHSTLLIGLVWLLARRSPARMQPMLDTLWKVALVGGLVTASWQVASGVPPLAGRVELPGAPASREAPAPAPADPVAAGAAGARTAAAIAAATRPAATASPTAAAPVASSRPRTGDLRPDGGAGASKPSPGVAGGTRSPVALAALGDPQGHAPADRHGRAPADLQTGAPPGAASPRIRLEWLNGWPVALLAVWVVGAWLGLARLAWDWRRLWRHLRRRRPVTGGPLLDLLADLRRAAGVRQPIRLTCSDHLPGPLALGTAEICLPARAVTDFSRKQQQSILAHELAHLVRRDPLWLVVASVIDAALFFQPLNRVARRSMQEAAEFQCDDWAVAKTGCRLTLAQCLAEVATWIEARSHPTLVAGMAESGSPLIRRIRRLLDESRPTTAGWPGRWQAPAAVGLVASLALLSPGVAAIGPDREAPQRQPDVLLPWGVEPGPAAPAGPAGQVMPVDAFRSRRAFATVVLGARPAPEERAGRTPARPDRERHRRALSTSGRYAPIVIGPDDGRTFVRARALVDLADSDGSDRDDWHGADDQAGCDGRDDRDPRRQGAGGRAWRAGRAATRRAGSSGRATPPFELDLDLAGHAQPRLELLGDHVASELPRLDKIEDGLADLVEPYMESVERGLEVSLRRRLLMALERELAPLVDTHLAELDTHLAELDDHLAELDDHHRLDRMDEDLDELVEDYVEDYMDNLESEIEDVLGPRIDEIVELEMERLQRQLEERLRQLER